MELALTEEQRMIQESAERFLAQVASSGAVRTAMAAESGLDHTAWARIARELYWPALAIPEEYGGLGLGFVEVCLLQEQLGRCLLPTPFFATCCMGIPALLLSRNQGLKNLWLPGWRPAKSAPAWPGPAPRAGTTAACRSMHRAVPVVIASTVSTGM